VTGGGGGAAERTVAVAPEDVRLVRFHVAGQCRCSPDEHVVDLRCVTAYHVTGGEPTQEWPRETPSARGPATSAGLGICDRICPDHNRRCDAYGTGAERNAGHPGRHACALCDDWRPR
jgi:hypothetical protein